MNTSRTPAPVRGILALMVVLFITQFSACGGGDSGLFALPITAPFALSYANSSAVYAAGQPIAPNTPSVRGGPVDSYAIKPSLPRGLVINPITGVIRGTPESPSPATIYAVTASNVAGSTVGRVQIEVSGAVVAPDSLRYPLVSALYTAGQQIPPNAPVTTGGEITQFSVDPSLPAGLSLNPQTGVISGAPGSSQPATPYTVTGANSAGDVQSSISIAVQEASVPPPTVTPPPITTTPPPIIITPPPTVAPPATVSYEDEVYVAGQPIVPNVPTLTGGPPAQFAVSPALPDGLAIDPTTGVISGAPTTAQTATPYTVTASNSAGQAQTTLTLAVTRVGAWSPSGSLSTKRTLHSASLRPDGTVLVAGGTTPKKGLSVLNLVEIRSPAGAWAAAASMTGRRFQQTSTTLQDGRVLVVGGVADTGSLLNSVEVFATDWSQAAPLATARAGHTATLLKDGRVLVTGGPTASVQIFHPGDGTWTDGAPMSRVRSTHTATLLADGRVLVAGGEGITGKSASAEVYDPAANTWSTIPDMSRPRGAHTASLLPDGSVLVPGGDDDSGVPTDQAELFDPQSMRWQLVPPMKVRRQVHTATTLLNGQVVVAGGRGLRSRFLASVEIFDPASRQWLSAASMASGRAGHTATLLPDGRLLVVAGQGDAGYFASSELFDISANGAQATAGTGP